MSGASSVLSDVGELMEIAGILLVFYVMWLSFGPRQMLVTQIRERKLIPIALIFTLYLMDALIATAHGAARDAELLMLGWSDASIAVAFTPKEGGTLELPDAELILVIARSSNYYVVERQQYPPSGRPVAYVIPFGSVDMTRVERINDAGVELEDDVYTFELLASPEAR
jgi:hypothetical protein